MKRKVRARPKGRTADPQALEDVRGLLGDAPRRRDLLIEHLHRINDRYGYLSAAHLAALAEEMRLALADRKSTRLNSSHGYISYAVFCLKKKKKLKLPVLCSQITLMRLGHAASTSLTP